MDKNLAIVDFSRLVFWWFGFVIKFTDGRCLEIGSDPKDTIHPHYLKVFNCDHPDHYLAHIILFPVDGEDKLHNHIITDIHEISMAEIADYLDLATTTFTGDMNDKFEHSWDVHAWQSCRDLLKQTDKAHGLLQSQTMMLLNDID